MIMTQRQFTSQISDSNLSWTDPVQIQGAQGKKSNYSIGTRFGQDKPQIFKKCFFKTNFTDYTFMKRLSELQSINHQNFIKVFHRDLKIANNGKQQIVNQFTVISEYYESIPVSIFIKQKKELYQSDLISIVEQMVNLMSYAQQKQIYHFHLNADSFLFIQSDFGQKNDIFLKICDWGYHNQICSRKQTKKMQSFLKKICKNSMFQYLHPQLLFEQNNQALMKQYKAKYDIWSFGIILYRLAYLKRPFQFKGSFSPEILKQFYEGKRNIQITNSFLISSLISKMLDLNGFKTWQEIKRFLIINAERTQTDFLGIKELYAKQIKIIYKLIAWNIMNSSNSFWYENKEEMKEFLVIFIKIILMVHCKKFIERYGHRMVSLSVEQKNEYDNLGRMIESQIQRRGLNSQVLKQEQNFFKQMDKLGQLLVFLQLRVKDQESSKSNRDYEIEKQSNQKKGKKKQLWPCIRVIKQFGFRFLQAKKNIQSLNRNILHCFFKVFLEAKSQKL